MTINADAPLDSPSPHSPRPAQHGLGASGAQKLVAAGGIVAAVAASSCCIVPLVLFGLGVSGAWIGHLTRLAPYQPYFIGVALSCLGYGAWLGRRARLAACAPGAACARPLPNRLVNGALVVAGFLVAAALAFDVLAPILLT